MNKRIYVKPNQSNLNVKRFDSLPFLAHQANKYISGNTISRNCGNYFCFDLQFDSSIVHSHECIFKCIRNHKHIAVLLRQSFEMRAS